MRSPRFLILSFLAAFAMCGGMLALAKAQAEEKAFSDAEKQKFEALIEDYLMNHPETIIKAVDAYQQRQAEQQDAGAVDALKENREALTGKELPSAGNPDADMVVVEFFDYNCGYCKRALPDLQTLLKEDPKLRVVFFDLPILSESSLLASKWALASMKQGKYFEYHIALMEHNGQKDEKELAKLAAGVGLDVEKLRKDAADASIEQTLEKHHALATKLNIQGTPGFIIGDQILRGYMGMDGMKEAIEQERGKKG